MLTRTQLDAGMHTGREGMAAMPYFDDFDLGTVDILLISQYVNHFLLFLFWSREWQWRVTKGSRYQSEPKTQLLRAMTQGDQRCSVSILYDRSGQYNLFQLLRSLDLFP